MTTAAFRAFHGPHEFDCCECCRHMIVLAGPPPAFDLCNACLMLPGWFTDPQLRESIDRGWTPPAHRSEMTS